jgi:8-oxo-dGTP diphosphatase
MMHRNKRPDDVHYGKYNGLGGKFEPGESPEDCVRREVLEESNLKIEPVFRGVMTFPKFSKGRDWYCFLYTAEHAGADLKKDCPEGDLVWIPTAGIMDLPLWPGDRIFLKWLDQPRFFSAKFIYEAGALVDHTVVFYG